jgi:ribosomal protein S28E/S33
VTDLPRTGGPGQHMPVHVDVRVEKDTDRVLVTITRLDGQIMRLRPTAREAESIARQLMRCARELTTEGDTD